MFGNMIDHLQDEVLVELHCFGSLQPGFAHGSQCKDCLSGAGLLTSPPGALGSCAEGSSFRIGSTLAAGWEDALVVEVGLFVVFGGVVPSTILEFG